MFNKGIILADNEGVPIKTTFTDDQITYFYSTSSSIFIKRCRNIVSELIEEEELTFIRIRTKQNEIMIAPGENLINIILNINRKYDLNFVFEILSQI